VDETADALAYSPNFNGAVTEEEGGVFDYSVIVPSTVDKILISPKKKPGVEIRYSQDGGPEGTEGKFDFPVSGNETIITLGVTDAAASPPVSLIYTITVKRPGKVSVAAGQESLFEIKTDFGGGTPRFKYGAPVVFEVTPPFGHEMDPVPVTFGYTPADGGPPVTGVPARSGSQYAFTMPDTGLVTLTASYSPIIPEADIAGKVKYVWEHGTGGGSSWADASGDLQAMIDLYGTSHEIWVSGGTLTTTGGFILKDTVKIYGGFKGTEKNWADKEGRAWQTQETILSGGNAAPHVVIAAVVGNQTRLERLTVSGGNSLTNSTPLTVNGKTISLKRGAGIYMVAASPVLRDVTVKNNVAGERGGGIYCEGSSSDKPVLLNVHISNNFGGYGAAGIYIPTAGCPRLLMIGGSVSGSQGGATAVEIVEASTLINVRIVDNRSWGFQPTTSAFDKESLFINVTISGNTGGISGFNSTGSYNMIIAYNSLVRYNGDYNVNDNRGGFISGSNNIIPNTPDTYAEGGLTNTGTNNQYPINPNGTDNTGSPAYSRLTAAASGILLNEIRELLKYDGAGNPRFNGTIDIGALEAQ
jgi:predicted outer membrane repeat protein